MKLIDIFESVELVNESFKDAANIFSKEADPTVVKFYLNKFRELSNRHMISGPEKDITTWIRHGFDKFKAFVAEKSQVISNKHKKSSLKMNGAVEIAEYPNWIVIAPLTAKASCQYGAGTKWCTSGRENNKFDDYFHNMNVNLFYLIPKNKSNEKYAVSCNRSDGSIAEIFDSEDSSIEIEDLEDYTNIADIEDQVRIWNQKIKPHQPAIKSMDERIAESTPSDALDIFLEKYNDLTANQINELRNKIATDIDALSEYCLVMKNNQDDPLFIEAPKIMLTSMLKHRLEFKYYTANLEDWIELANDRSTAIEALLPKLSKELKSNGGPMYQSAVDRIAKAYAAKHWHGEDEKRIYNILIGTAS